VGVRVGIRGLTDTKEGRLVVICLVGGSLMLVVALGNMAMASAADNTAGEVRRALRRELAAVNEDTLAGYPQTAGEIEAVAVDALVGRSARVLGVDQPEDDAIVVAVQSGWAWQVRCVRAELRGDATVLTYVESRPC
jgi:hypothetical protein